LEELFDLATSDLGLNFVVLERKTSNEQELNRHSKHAYVFGSLHNFHPVFSCGLDTRTVSGTRWDALPNKVFSWAPNIYV
jgi:hypothetical protein